MNLQHAPQRRSIARSNAAPEHTGQEQASQKLSKVIKETEIARNPNLEIIKNKDFISINQASDLFGISRRTLYRIISRRELDIAKFGTRTVIRRCDLDGFFSIPLEESTI